MVVIKVSIEEAQRENRGEYSLEIAIFSEVLLAAHVFIAL